MNVNDLRPQSECIDCGGWYDAEDGFRVTDGARMHAPRRATCKLCEQTKRDQTKQQNRWLVKAMNTLSHHARKVGIARGEFAARFDWIVKRMAYELEHAYENTCTYCWTAYTSMAHGMRDITVDIVDPKLPPYWATNVRICCATCNTSKSNMTAEQWARYLAYCRQWRERMAYGPRPKQADFFE